MRAGRSRDAILAHVARELARPPGLEARRFQYLAEWQFWWSAPEIVKFRGVPVELLRLMREHGCGPVWRPAGREVLYDIREFDSWMAQSPGWVAPPAAIIPPGRDLSGRPAASLPESLDAIARRFIASMAPHRGDSWMTCAEISWVFRAFCLAHGGLAPGWKKALWIEIRAAGFKFSQRGLAFAHRARTVDGFSSREAMCRARVTG